MDFTRLHYLSTVAELKSISKAAKQLYISQPALTKAINKVEDELGVKLFDRSSSPIRLTYAGERYIEEMTRMREIDRHLQKEIEEISMMRRGRLTIGIGSSRGMFWLPYILPPFLEQYPQFDVKIIEGSSEMFEEEMSKGAIDLSFYALPVLSADIDYEVLVEERILLSVPRGHPILDGQELADNSPFHLHHIPPERLNGQHFLMLKPGQGLYRTTHLIFERHGIKPGSVMELENGDTAFLLSAQGSGLCFTPECVHNLRFPNEPVYCTVEDPPYSRLLIAAYKRDVPLSIAAKKFIEITRRIVTVDLPEQMRQAYEK